MYCIVFHLAVVFCTWTSLSLFLSVLSHCKVRSWLPKVRRQDRPALANSEMIWPKFALTKNCAKKVSEGPVNTVRVGCGFDLAVPERGLIKRLCENCSNDAALMHSSIAFEHDSQLGLKSGFTLPPHPTRLWSLARYTGA